LLLLAGVVVEVDNLAVEVLVDLEQVYQKVLVAHHQQQNRK